MIHQYKSNGFHIVMDINSGSVHVVDEIVYDMISLVEPLVEEGIKDAALIKAPAVSHQLLYHLPVHGRLAPEKIHLQIDSVSGICHQKIQRDLRTGMP